MKARAFVYFALRLELLKRSMLSWRQDGFKPEAQVVRVKDVGFYRPLMRNYFNELLMASIQRDAADECEALRGCS